MVYYNHEAAIKPRKEIKSNYLEVVTMANDKIRNLTADEVSRFGIDFDNFHKHFLGKYAIVRNVTKKEYELSIFDGNPINEKCNTVLFFSAKTFKKLSEKILEIMQPLYDEDNA